MRRKYVLIAIVASWSPLFHVTVAHISRASKMSAPPASRPVSARLTHESLRVHCVEQVLVEEFTLVLTEIFQLLQAKAISTSTGKDDKTPSSAAGTSGLPPVPRSTLDVSGDGDTPTGVGTGNNDVHEGTTPTHNPTNDESTLSTDGGLETPRTAALNVDRRDSAGLRIPTKEVQEDADCATENGSEGCGGASRWLESPQIFISKVLHWAEEAIAARGSKRGASKESGRRGLPKPPKRTIPSQ